MISHADVIRAVKRMRPDSPFRTEGLAVEMLDGTAAPTAEEIETAAALPLAPVAPARISDRQFFQALAHQGIISQEEALAAVQTGAIPAVMTGVVDSMTGDARFAAQMLLSGATVFERDHPLTSAFGATQGMDEAAIDGFFAFAASL